jgi:cbb3-type cytochrome c oxidase subunit III
MKIVQRPLTFVMATVAIAATWWAASALSAQGLQAPAAHGKTIYESRCVECHGASGRGDGPAGSHLSPAPRDFTSAKYKIRSTETGSIPTDTDMAQSIKQGLAGSAMPAWSGILSDADIRDVVEYLKTLSPRFAGETPKVVALPPPVASSADSIARGQKAFDKLQCGKCHGTDGRGAGAVATEFQDDWRQPLHSTDLTKPWTFHGGSTPRDVFLRFRTGMSGTPMPSFADAASDAEMWDLANYVVSLAGKPLWSMNADEVKAFYAQQDASERADPVKRGAYLVETLGCSLCHSPADENRRALPGMRLAGGLLVHVEPFGDYPTGNLTSDKATGLGNWTDDQIKQVVTRGVLPDGTRLLPYPMDWASYSTMKAEDLSAIVAYLRTVPPVSNKVPRPTRTFLPVYLWGKFKMLFLGNDPPMVFFPGNAGTKGGQR